jgi:hypothetical protein
MKNLYLLKQSKNELQTAAERARSLADALDASVQRAKNDKSRSPAWIDGEINRLRSAAVPAIAEIVSGFDKKLAEILANKPFWDNKKLILSLQKFDENDLQKDAVIRSARLQELEHMDGALLQITAENAAFDENLPEYWLCYLLGQKMAGKPGWSGLSIDDIQIPDRDEALKIFDQCKALVHAAHVAFSVANGRVLTGTEKLANARMVQALG